MMLKQLTPSNPVKVAQLLRYFILMLMILGLLGSTAELVLIGHYQEFSQMIPFILIALASISLIFFIYRPSQFSLRILQIVMVLLLIGSGIGVYEHFEGNREFALEIKPNLVGWPLFLKSIKGGLPLLAPGMLVQVALLGLAYGFRHPRLVVFEDYGERA